MSMGSRTVEALSPPGAAARTDAGADTSDCGNTAGTVARLRTCVKARACLRRVNPPVPRGSPALSHKLRMLNARLTPACAHRTLRPFQAGEGTYENRGERRCVNSLGRLQPLRGCWCSCGRPHGPRRLSRVSFVIHQGACCRG